MKIRGSPAILAWKSLHILDNINLGAGSGATGIARPAGGNDNIGKIDNFGGGA